MYRVHQTQKMLHPKIEWCRTNVDVPFRRMDGHNRHHGVVQDRKVHLVASDEPQQAYKIMCNNQIPPKQKVFNGICYAIEYNAIRIPRAKEAADDDARGNDDDLEVDETNTLNNETELLLNEPTISTPVFLESSTGDDKVYERVSITCVDKSYLKLCWEQPQEEGMMMLEDPYKDILLMQMIGDGIHVVKCIEALQTKDALFIVTPYIEQNLSHWKEDPLSEEIARGYFRQMIDILKYLRSKGICHGNLSPDKFSIDTNGRPILTGLGWMPISVLPVEGGIEARKTKTLVVENTIGKLIQPPTYLSPEVFMMFPFDSYALDLWSSVIILFYLLTGGGTLYEKPTYEDALFCYFILAGGISPSNQNSKLCFDALADIGEQQQQKQLVAKFLDLFVQCSLLSPEATELFENALRLSVETRWSLDDVETCSWVRGSHFGVESPLFVEIPQSNQF